ncbi:hypothetical protein OIH30_10270 [Lactococcus petauri]|uniref:hypothetical protein n=1 Tax=Lactococcus petauri TaxID=1940789 RepID=UPI0021F157E7|nr:hypothetical protein [Lactococcus petauri]MCV5953905.1 hypothetical protein [Lactococcus petauri]
MTNLNDEKRNKLKMKRSELHKQALQLSNQIIETEIEFKEIKNDKSETKLIGVLEDKLIAISTYKDTLIEQITLIQIKIDQIGRY